MTGRDSLLSFYVNNPKRIAILVESESTRDLSRTLIVTGTDGVRYVAGPSYPSDLNAERSYLRPSTAKKLGLSRALIDRKLLHNPFTGLKCSHTAFMPFLDEFGFLYDQKTKTITLFPRGTNPWLSRNGLWRSQTIERFIKTRRLSKITDVFGAPVPATGSHELLAYLSLTDGTSIRFSALPFKWTTQSAYGQFRLTPTGVLRVKSLLKSTRTSTDLGTPKVVSKPSKRTRSRKILVAV
jgi:hypothetical protein